MSLADELFIPLRRNKQLCSVGVSLQAAWVSVSISKYERSEYLD